MRGRAAVAPAGAVAVVAGAVVAALVLGGGDGAPPRPADRPAADGRTVPPRPAVRPPFGARLLRRTQLRQSPGGPVVRALGPRTGFGSPRVLAVVGRRPGWLAVLSHHRPGRSGWIPAAAAMLLHQPYTLHADVSDREVVVRREGVVVRRVRVAVGRPETPTPSGRFAVTDLLRAAAGSPYGCCALALTGRQRNLARGWRGGDRLALHGTTSPGSVGGAVSGGCLRAADADMRWLMARVHLGAPVTIRA